MTIPSVAERALEFHPLTPERWPDLVRLFGERGASSGCWCMYWRLPGSQFRQTSGAEKRQALRGVIESGEIPGILAYVDGQPAGWCAIAPRERLGRLERSRTLKRIDDQPVWSIVCFFVDRRFRRQGLLGRLIDAAVAHARANGARIVEAYPSEPNRDRVPGVDLYLGVTSTFRAAGFVEVARTPHGDPIVRRVLE